MNTWIINRNPSNNHPVIVYVPEYCETGYQIARWSDNCWENEEGDDITKYVEGWTDFTKFKADDTQEAFVTFYDALKNLLVVDDVFIEYDRVPSVDGWPEVDGEVLSTENCEVVDITKTKIIFFAGGDWQEDPQNVTIELVDGKLKVTEHKSAKAPDTPLTEDEILEKLGVSE